MQLIIKDRKLMFRIEAMVVIFSVSLLWNLQRQENANKKPITTAVIKLADNNCFSGAQKPIKLSGISLGFFYL